MHLPRRDLAHDRLPTGDHLEAIESGVNQGQVAVLCFLALVEDGLADEEPQRRLPSSFCGREPENPGTGRRNP
jgi:hypothetical protein